MGDCNCNPDEMSTSGPSRCMSCVNGPILDKNNYKKIQKQTGVSSSLYRMNFTSLVNSNKKEKDSKYGKKNGSYHRYLERKKGMVLRKIIKDEKTQDSKAIDERNYKIPLSVVTNSSTKNCDCN